MEDRDTVMRMVKAHVEGIAYFENNKEFSYRVLSNQLKINDRDTLENSYDTYKQDFISGALSDHERTGSDLRLRCANAAGNPQRKPDEFVDPSFIAELDKSGFIKKLYEQK